MKGKRRGWDHACGSPQDLRQPYSASRPAPSAPRAAPPPAPAPPFCGERGRGRGRWHGAGWGAAHPSPPLCGALFNVLFFIKATGGAPRRGPLLISHVRRRRRRRAGEREGGSRGPLPQGSLREAGGRVGLLWGLLWGLL